MSLKALKGPLALLLVQVAPVTVQRDTSGGVQITLGYGTGQYENVTDSCQGAVLSSDAIRYHDAAALLEYWRSGGLRL